MLIKVTRIEIWDVQDVDNPEPNRLDIHDSIQDDILNSQDNEHETDDNRFHYTPKQLVSLVTEELCGCGGPKDHKGNCDNWMSEQEDR